MNWLKNYPPQIINRKRKHQEFRENNQNLQMTFWLQVICQPIMKYLRGSFSGGRQYIIVIRVAQIVAAWLQENGERMRKWRGKGEKMRKWREFHFLHFLILIHLTCALWENNCVRIFGLKWPNLAQNMHYWSFWAKYWPFCPIWWHARPQKQCEQGAKVVFWYVGTKMIRMEALLMVVVRWLLYRLPTLSCLLLQGSYSSSCDSQL